VKEKFIKGLHRAEKGFTLIELLIVIAILGIIAAIVIPDVAGFMLIGTLNAANTESKNVQTAATGYLTEHGVWPDSSDDIGDFLETGIADLKAKYEFGGDAGIESVSAQDWEGIYWDADSQNWKKGEAAAPAPAPPGPLPPGPILPGPVPHPPVPVPGPVPIR
jgi:type IV pilus assembly protein PilA